jgi:hypothetical protein
MLPYCDILAPTKSSKRIRIAFTASEELRGGVLVISNDRTAEDYAVVEFDPDWRGRSFCLAKYNGPEAYSVFCGSPEQTTCDCHGFQAHAHCKHVAALERLIAEGCL